MNLKSINESFKKLLEAGEPIVIDEMSDKEAVSAKVPDVAGVHTTVLEAEVTVPGILIPLA